MLRISAGSFPAGPFVIRYPAQDRFSGDLQAVLRNPVIYGKGAVLFETQENTAQANVLIVSLGQITDQCIRARAACQKTV